MQHHWRWQFHVWQPLRDILWSAPPGHPVSNNCSQQRWLESYQGRRGLSDKIIGYDLTEDAPDYVSIATAASNGTLWGKRVKKARDLISALQTAVRIVETEKRGALLEVVIS